MLQPILNRILVEIDQASTEVKQGPIFVAGKVPPYITGKVLAVGPGDYDAGVLVPIGVDVGQVIAFNQNRGIPTKLSAADKIEQCILTNQDVLGIVRDT